jgi:TolB-like protein|tara:strand:- start:412 stop:1446 length:1035 start_codon:yes stop_codon:yes gene_type:complete
MQRFLQSLPYLLFLSLILIFSNINAQDRLYNTMAVLVFEGNGIGQSESDAITDQFTIELKNTQSVLAIVSKEIVKEILDERQLSDKICTNESCAMEIGEILGVDHVVIGSVTKSENWFSMEVEIISVETGVVDSRKSFYMGDPNGLIVEIGLLAWNLMNKVSPHSLLEEKAKKEREAQLLAEQRAAEAAREARRRLRKAKLGAMLRSTVLPGWGQFNSGRKGWGWFWLGSELAIGGAAYMTYTEYDKAYNEFEEIYPNYNAATDHEEIAALKAQAIKVLDEEMKSNEQLLMLAYAGGAFWVANMVHAYVSGQILEQSSAEKSGFVLVYDPQLKSPQLRFYIALD